MRYRTLDASWKSHLLLPPTEKLTSTSSIGHEAQCGARRFRIRVTHTARTRSTLFGNFMGTELEGLWIEVPDSQDGTHVTSVALGLVKEGRGSYRSKTAGATSRMSSNMYYCPKLALSWSVLI